MGQDGNLEGNTPNNDLPFEDDENSENPSYENDDPEDRDLIEYIPEERREELVRSLVLREEYSGPIAHPRIIAGYEKYLSGSTDRILTMAEEQQRHRLRMEDRGQLAAIQRDRLSMYLGFALGLALIALAAYAVTLAYPLASVAFIGLAAASLASAFFIGHRRTHLELREKRELLDHPSVPPRLPGRADDVKE